MRWRKRRSCSSSPTVEEVLEQRDARLGDQRLEVRDLLQEARRRLLGAVAHDPLDAGAVVPAAVEDQHLAGGGQLLDVALHVELGLLPVGRRRQRDDAEHPRADPLGQALDHAALAGGVAALEDDDDAGAARLHPGLQVRDLDLQPGELLLVGLVARLLRVGGSGRGRRLARPLPSCASCSWGSSLRARRLEGAQRVVEVVEDHRRGRWRRAARPGRAGRAPRRAARRGRRPMPRPARSARTSSSIAAAVRVDLGDGAGVEEQPAGAGRHRVGDGVQPGVDVVGVEEQQVALDQRDRRGPGPGCASGRRCSL